MLGAAAERAASVAEVTLLRASARLGCGELHAGAMTAPPRPSRPPLIGVCGTSRDEPSTNEMAERVGGLIATRGGIVVCGGLGGVMAAAARGAARGGWLQRRPAPR